MNLRAQIATALVLLAAVAVVFVLVSTGDMHTDVFSAEPTATVPPTPLPAPSAEDWEVDEADPNRWTYTADPDIPAQLNVEDRTLDAVATELGVVAPGDDVALPGLDLLTQFRDDLDTQYSALGGESPMTFEGPATRLLGGVPVSILRLTAGLAPDVGFPEGLDFTFALIEQAGGTYKLISGGYQGLPSDKLYQSIEAWLTVYAPEFAEPSDDTAEDAEAPATDGATADDPAAEGEATSAPEDAAPDETAPSDDPPADTSAAPAGEEQTAAPQEELPLWSEIAPGQYYYTGPEAVAAQIGTEKIVLAEFLAQAGLDMAAEDSETPMLDILDQMVVQIQDQIAAQNITVTEDGVTAPAVQTINGVEIATTRVQIDTQTLEDGSEYPGIDIVLGLVDLGDGQATAIQYVLQGDLNPAVYDAFMTWLEEHAAELATPAPEVAAPESSAPAESPGETEADPPAENTD